MIGDVGNERRGHRCVERRVKHGLHELTISEWNEVWDACRFRPKRPIHPLAFICCRCTKVCCLLYMRLLGKRLSRDLESWNLGITGRAPRLVSSCLSLPPQHRHGQSFGEFSVLHPKNVLVLTLSSQANIFGTGKCYRLRGALALIRIFRAGPCKLFVLLQGPLFSVQYRIWSYILITCRSEHAATATAVPENISNLRLVRPSFFQTSTIILQMTPTVN